MTKITELFEVAKPKNNVSTLLHSWRDEYKEQIGVKVRKETFGTYKVEPYGIVHKAKRLVIYDFMLDANGELPVKFFSCNSLEINTNKLTSFKNFPEQILRDIHINTFDPSFGKGLSHDGGNISKITSLEGFPSTITGPHLLNLQMFPNLSFRNADKYMTRLSGAIIIINKNYVGPLLGFLKIKWPPQSIEIVSDTVDGSKFSNGNIAGKIITKYLKGSKDAWKCQEELMDNDLHEYAEI
jgi:hypothetical protein